MVCAHTDPLAPRSPAPVGGTTSDGSTPLGPTGDGPGRALRPRVAAVPRGPSQEAESESSDISIGVPGQTVLPSAGKRKLPEVEVSSGPAKRPRGRPRKNPAVSPPAAVPVAGKGSGEKALGENARRVLSPGSAKRRGVVPVGTPARGISKIRSAAAPARAEPAARPRGRPKKSASAAQAAAVVPPRTPPVRCPMKPVAGESSLGAVKTTRPVPKGSRPVSKSVAGSGCAGQQRGVRAFCRGPGGSQANCMHLQGQACLHTMWKAGQRGGGAVLVLLEKGGSVLGSAFGCV